MRHSKVAMTSVEVPCMSFSTRIILMQAYLISCLNFCTCCQLGRYITASSFRLSSCAIRVGQDLRFDTHKQSSG